MARLPRFHLPDLPQHLWTRGNNRSAIFQDDADRWMFLHLLEKALQESGCDLHAFVLMSNHVHLLVTPQERASTALLMQSIGRRYARFFNARRQRTGTLFEGRYKSSPVQADRYFLALMRYIEENPVRAGMASAPQHYRWSSFLQNASGAPAGTLRPHALYTSLGADDEQRAAAYVGLFNQPIAPGDIDAIREALRMDRVLGTADYCSQLESGLGRPAGITPHGGSRVHKISKISRGQVAK